MVRGRGGEVEGGYSGILITLEGGKEARFLGQKSPTWLTLDPKIPISGGIIL